MERPLRGFRRKIAQYPYDSTGTAPAANGNLAITVQVPSTEPTISVRLFLPKRPSKILRFLHD